MNWSMAGNFQMNGMLDYEEVEAALARRMRVWLGERVAESVMASVIDTGPERLKSLISATSEKAGVEERVIARKLTEALEPALGQKLAMWYEGWKGTSTKGGEALKNSLPGDSYLVYADEAPDAATSIFIERVLDGKHGLVLTRRARPEILGFDISEVKIVMVRKQLSRLFWPSSETSGGMADGRERSLDLVDEMPLLKIIRSHLESHPDSVVLVDCAEYLKVINGFQKLYALLADIADIMNDSGGLMIVGLHSQSFSDGELATLESMMETLVERPAGVQKPSPQPAGKPSWSVNPA
ncbi:MAG: DUF835 domain-containing protein [Methanobacteriota archaeon]